MLESDIECGVCHASFNPKKKEVTDRVLLKFTLERALISVKLVQMHFAIMTSWMSEKGYLAKGGKHEEK